MTKGYRSGKMMKISQYVEILKEERDAQIQTPQYSSINMVDLRGLSNRDLKNIVKAFVDFTEKGPKAKLTESQIKTFLKF